MSSVVQLHIRLVEPAGVSISDLERDVQACLDAGALAAALSRSTGPLRLRGLDTDDVALESMRYDGTLEVTLAIGAADRSSLDAFAEFASRAGEQAADLAESGFTGVVRADGSRAVTFQQRASMLRSSAAELGAPHGDGLLAWITTAEGDHTARRRTTGMRALQSLARLAERNARVDVLDDERVADAPTSDADDVKASGKADAKKGGTKASGQKSGKGAKTDKSDKGAKADKGKAKKSDKGDAKKSKKGKKK